MQASPCQPGKTRHVGQVWGKCRFKPGPTRPDRRWANPNPAQPGPRNWRPQARANPARASPCKPVIYEHVHAQANRARNHYMFNHIVGLCTTLCMTASNADVSPSTKFSKPDKTDLTKPGLTRNLAKPNPSKPVKVFHICNPVKPGPQKNQTRLDPNQPGGTLIYIYIYIYVYTYIYMYMCSTDIRHRALRVWCDRVFNFAFRLLLSDSLLIAYN